VGEWLGMTFPTVDLVIILRRSGEDAMLLGECPFGNIFMRFLYYV